MTLLVVDLCKIRFPPHLSNLIMNCVATIHFHIPINGEPTEQFAHSRSLRHGDPLSPYLFILCAEGFLNLINHVVTNGLWKGSGIQCTSFISFIFLLMIVFYF